jgi:ferredoxin-NADP reductase
VQLVLSEGEKTITRSYSISSDPSSSYFELCVKVISDGLGSSYVSQLPIGQEALFYGPLGKFVNNDAGTPMVCIATGVGLAPIMSIIEDELQNKQNTQPIQLLFGVRNESDIFWIDRLDHLASEFSNFSYQLTLSQPDALWGGLSGRVTEYMTQLRPEAHYFLCGNAEMVKEVRQKLVAKDITPRQIHFEIF